MVHFAAYMISSSWQYHSCGDPFRTYHNPGLRLGRLVLSGASDISALWACQGFIIYFLNILEFGKIQYTHKPGGLKYA